MQSETSEDNYESESVDDTFRVKTINDMVGDIIKNLHRNEYGDCKDYTFEEHTEMIRIFEKNCNFKDNLDLTSAIKAAKMEEVNTIDNLDDNCEIIKYRNLCRQYHCETLRSTINTYYKAHNLEGLDLKYIEKQHVSSIKPTIELLEIEALMAQFARLENIADKQGPLGAKHVRLILNTARLGTDETHEDCKEGEKNTECLSAQYNGAYYLEHLHGDKY